MIEMITQSAAEGIAMLSGLGGVLACLALVLVVRLVGRRISSPRRSKTRIVTEMPPGVDPSAKAIEEKAPAPQLPSSQPKIRVLRSIQPTLDWEKQADRWVGSYRTSTATYDGYIRNLESARREFYIVSPPQVLLNHTNGRALIHRGNGRYQVQFAVAPHSAVAGVEAIERMLIEAEAAPQQAVRPLVRPLPRARAVITPKFRPYWELMHWAVQGDQLVGRYQTPDGSAGGYIKQFRHPRPQFYIVDPPMQLRSHPHWPCFHSIGANQFGIHFNPAPPNPDAGILEVEKVLAEALKPRRRKS